MTWIVRNKLRGTLELHGFLPLGRPVRIPGGESFDLDSLPVPRETVSSSRQLQVAFREDYLETLERNDEASPEATDLPESRDVELIRWQADLQDQLNTQARSLEQLGTLVSTLIDRVETLGARPTGEGTASLDAEALRKILRREHQNQVQTLTQAMRTGEAGEGMLTEREAENRVRLIEGNLGGLEADIAEDATDRVTRIDSTTNNTDKIDLLSNLGGMDDL